MTNTACGSQHATHSMAARHLRLPEHCLKATENCFYFMAAKQWNKLSNDLTKIQSHSAFIKAFNENNLTQLS